MKDKELRGVIGRVLALALAFAAIGGLLGQGLQAHPGVAVLTLVALVFGAGTLTGWGRTLLPNGGHNPGTAGGRPGRQVTCDFGHRATVWVTDGPRTPVRWLARRRRTWIQWKTPDPDCPSCRQLEQELKAALDEHEEPTKTPPRRPEPVADEDGLPPEDGLLGPGDDAPTCRFGHQVTVRMVYHDLTVCDPAAPSPGSSIRLVTRDPTCPGCQQLRHHVESALQRIQQQEWSTADTDARPPSPSDQEAAVGSTRPPTRSDAPAESGAQPPTQSDVPADDTTADRDIDTPICDFGHRVTVGLVYGESTAVDLATGKISTRVELVTPDSTCPGCRRLHHQVEDALRAARERGSLTTPAEASLTQASDVDVSLD